MKKQLIKFCLVLTVCIGLLFAFMQLTHAITEDIDGVRYLYTIENESVVISHVIPLDNFNVVVPEEIGGYPVTKINSFNASDVITAVLPDTVTTLGDFIFNYCEKLTSVTLSQNLESISECAFTNCKKLKKVNIPAKVTRIEYAAFNKCESLEDISLSENITYIGRDAFDSCKSLKTINFPNGLTYIDAKAFFHCTQLQTVLIPKSVTYIGEQCFAQSYRDDTDLSSTLVSRTYDNICYTGSQEEWNRITIDQYNDNLKNSTIKFNVPTCFVKINEGEENTDVVVTPENMRSSIIIVSAYNNEKGAFAKLAYAGAEDTTVSIPNFITFDKIKVFVLENNLTLKPMCTSVTRIFTLR